MFLWQYPHCAMCGAPATTVDLQGDRRGAHRAGGTRNSVRRGPTRTAATPVELLEAQLNLDAGTDAALLAHKLAAAEAWIAAHTGAPFPASDAPPPLTDAALQLAAYWYENREATLVGVAGQAVPYGVAELLGPYRASVVGHVPV